MVKLTDEQRHDRAMSEAELKRLVLEVAHDHGWKIYHQTHTVIRRPQKRSSGYPDLTLARQGKVIWIELKKELGELEPDQAGWLRELPGMQTYIIKPSDYRAGLVERLLA